VRRGSTSSPPSAAGASTSWAPSSAASAPRHATLRCAPS
jgi:hypothetical protein